MAARIEIVPLGECALIVKFGNAIEPSIHRKVLRFMRLLEERAFPGFQEAVPSYAAVAVYYNPYDVSRSVRDSNPQTQVRRWLEESLNQGLTELSAVAELKDEYSEVGEGGGREVNAGTFGHSRLIQIPVCYCPLCGPDLPDVAKMNRLTPEDVIDIHTSGSYKVYMIGFMPGFPYLGGMSERIAAPRLTVPKKSVPAGSVGIAGRQTGIYPFSSPGGWRLIGRTTTRLFDERRDPPSLCAAGDTLRFYRIDHSEMAEGGRCSWRQR
jgi:inhibitor of KinA